MLTDQTRWSLGRGKPLVPSRWQATGFAAYVWVTKPNGQRQRKYIYGQTRQEVHDKWLTLQQ